MRASSRGFTLLEILVVLVLVGILSSFALLAAGGGPHERLAEEARRLAALVELQQQEALLSGDLRAIQFDRAGYAILSLGPKGRWEPVAAANSLTRRALPDGIELKLWVEDRPVDLKATESLPQVLLLNSGETTAFVAVFSLSEADSANAPWQRVTGDGLGRLTLGEITR